MIDLNLNFVCLICACRSSQSIPTTRERLTANIAKSSRYSAPSCGIKLIPRISYNECWSTKVGALQFQCIKIINLSCNSLYLASGIIIIHPQEAKQNLRNYKTSYQNMRLWIGWLTKSLWKIKLDGLKHSLMLYRMPVRILINSLLN
jgi:hypothetical protein